MKSHAVKRRPPSFGSSPLWFSSGETNRRDVCVAPATTLNSFSFSRSCAPSSCAWKPPKELNHSAICSQPACSKHHGTCDYSTRALSDCLSSVNAAIYATEKKEKGKKRGPNDTRRQLKTDRSRYRCNQVEIVRPVHTFLPLIQEGGSQYFMFPTLIDFHLWLILFRLSWLHGQSCLHRNTDWKICPSTF